MMMTEGATLGDRGRTVEREGGSIDRHATALNVQVQEIHAQLDVLLERLAPVLLPDTTDDKLADATPVPRQSGLADHLESTLSSARAASNRIQAIRDRLDL